MAKISALEILQQCIDSIEQMSETSFMRKLEEKGLLDKVYDDARYQDDLIEVVTFDYKTTSYADSVNEEYDLVSNSSSLAFYGIDLMPAYIKNGQAATDIELPMAA